jgi:hypothetical protein
MNLTPQAQTVLGDLQAGFELTARDARKFYRVRNLRARVSELRRAGFCVYTNRREGRTTYRLGQPKRSMIALAYNVHGPALFQA